MVYSQAQFNIDLINIKIETNNKLLSILATGQILDYSIITAKNDKDLGEYFDTLKEGLSNHENTEPSHYFHGMLLIKYVSCLEYFFVELMKLILTKYPHKVGKVEFALSDILDMTNDELVILASERYINKIMYKKPQDYLNELCTTLSISKEELVSPWSGYIEAKARRDLGIHNDWKVNETYLKKNKEAGNDNIDKNIGELAFPDRNYINSVFNLSKELINNIVTQVEAKYVETN